jgi:hypothetical protein
MAIDTNTTGCFHYWRVTRGKYFFGRQQVNSANQQANTATQQANDALPRARTATARADAYARRLTPQQAEQAQTELQEAGIGQ